MSAINESIINIFLLIIFSIFVHVLDFVGLAGHALLILHVLFANELCLHGA